MQTASAEQGPISSPAFQKVRDSRGHKIRGLWRRGKRFYSQMTVLKDGRNVVRRVPLDATTTAEAVKERAALIAKRDSGVLAATTNSSTIAFSTVADEYTAFIVGRKAQTSVNAETSAIRRLKDVFGPVPIRNIVGTQIQDFVSTRLQSGLSPGTINRLRSILNNVMAFAKTRKYIARIPVWDVDWLDYTPNPRKLISSADVDAFCAAALTAGRPQSFVDYIRLLAYSGGRKTECIRLQWVDVLWNTKQLRFRSELTKNGRTRHVNFNPQLEALLTAMTTRRRPETQFLFPSPWDSRGDVPRSQFWADFAITKRSMGKCPIADFHTLRHFFISTCVMAGIDFMTIASWVGHQDGGILIGSVYGHLNDQHKQNMATKLTFV